MRKKVIAGLSIVFVVSCLASYRFGIIVAQQAYGNGVQETQAMLSFNHLMRYQELANCMERGKFEETTEKLRHSVISERELLADLLKSVSSSQLDKYIEIRSDESLAALRDYKSDRGDRWSEPACQ